MAKSTYRSPCVADARVFFGGASWLAQPSRLEKSVQLVLSSAIMFRLRFAHVFFFSQASGFLHVPVTLLLECKPRWTVFTHMIKTFRPAAGS